MATETKIEWADHTASPWYGCSEVHAGCDLRVASQSFQENCWQWNARARESGVIETVFPSMCDPFEDFAGLDAERVKLFATIDACRSLRFILLTKRPENIRRMWHPPAHPCCTRDTNRDGDCDRHPNGHRPNVWLLTSVSDQASADAQIPPLLECRDLAPVLGVSCEPLLGPVELRNSFPPDWDAFEDATCGQEGWEEPEEFEEECERECDWVNFGHDLVPSREHAEWSRDRIRYAKLLAIKSRLDWVIVGGESGPHARPMHPDWARSLRDQCDAAGVPFFFKQWGEWSHVAMEAHRFERQLVPDRCGGHFAMWRIGKKAAGRTLDGCEWSEFPTTL